MSKFESNSFLILENQNIKWKRYENIVHLNIKLKTNVKSNIIIFKLPKEIIPKDTYCSKIIYSDDLCNSHIARVIIKDEISVVLETNNSSVSIGPEIITYFLD